MFIVSIKRKFIYTVKIQVNSGSFTATICKTLRTLKIVFHRLPCTRITVNSHQAMNPSSIKINAIKSMTVILMILLLQNIIKIIEVFIKTNKNILKTGR